MIQSSFFLMQASFLLEFCYANSFLKIEILWREKEYRLDVLGEESCLYLKLRHLGLLFIFFSPVVPLWGCIPAQILSTSWLRLFILSLFFSMSTKGDLFPRLSLQKAERQDQSWWQYKQIDYTETTLVTLAMKTFNFKMRSSARCLLFLSLC